MLVAKSSQLCILKMRQVSVYSIFRFNTEVMAKFNTPVFHQSFQKIQILSPSVSTSTISIRCMTSKKEDTSNKSGKMRPEEKNYANLLVLIVCFITIFYLSEAYDMHSRRDE